MAKTLYVSATAQTMANYHTIWHLISNQQDIQQIVILTTEFSHQKRWAEILKNLLISSEKFTFKGDIKELFLPNGIEESNIHEIQSLIEKSLKQFHINEAIFNITGGTKLISIALDWVAQNYPDKIKAVYQSLKGELSWYSDTIGNQQKIEKITPMSDIEIYLNAYGYQKTEKETEFSHFKARNLEYVQLMQRFLKQYFKKAQHFITFLNYHASRAENEQFVSEVKRSDRKYYKNWLEELSNMSDSFLIFDTNSSKIVFKKQEDVNFVKGNWFEFFIAYNYFLINSSLKLNIGVEFMKNNSPNEADVAFVYNGYFYFTETKTEKWGEKGVTAVNRYISHLDSIGDVAGLTSKKIFASLYEISDKSTINANNKDIMIIAGSDILDEKKYREILA